MASLSPNDELEPFPTELMDSFVDDSALAGRVVVVAVDVDELVVPKKSVEVVVFVAVVTVLVVVVIVTVVVVGRSATRFRHCSIVCVVSSFFRSSRWPVSWSMKPGSPTRAIQSPNLCPQTTSRYSMTVSLREYTELALRTFTPKGSITSHSVILSAFVEPAKPITSLLCGPNTSESEPATQRSERATTPTVTIAAATPHAPRHREQLWAVRCRGGCVLVVRTSL
mmetsp:Transcript_24956/g.48683  ORF Transcript_24956/g.48683 Transcript_24956/m.48683 type:complete len:225 (-) Transcript_24956:149-823(-)